MISTEELQRLVDEATPGPWVFDSENCGKSGEWCWQIRTEHGGTPIYVECSDRFNRDKTHEVIADLISHTPDLAREVIALHKVVEALRRMNAREESMIHTILERYDEAMK